MKAVAVTPKIKNSDRIVELDKPEIKENEVLVKTLEVGIDGTDIEIINGLYGEPPKEEKFLIIGHESFGVVEEAGKNVKEFNEKEYVVATVRRPDDCVNCRAGKYDMCIKGDYEERGIKGMHGFMSEYYKEKPEFLVKVPRTLRHVAVLLEPLSIVEKAVSQAFKIQERLVWKPKVAVIFGAGTIGLLATILLRLKGMETYTFARRKESAASKLVKKIGGEYISSTEVGIERLQSYIGKNVDIIVEATGSSEVAFKGINVLGTNGVMALTSITGGENMLTVPADCINLCMVIGNKVVFGSVNSNKRHFIQGIGDMESIEGGWKGVLEKMITKKVSLEKYREILEKYAGEIKNVVVL